MNYQQTLDYLFTAMPSFQNVGGDAYKPGLERVEAFCNALGDPHLRYPVIHIAGTNGKGSTSHMMASVLQGSGYSVGLFTSPHLRDFRERMRINGVTISEAEVVEFVATHRSTMEQLSLSFFEMTAAMAFDFFARNGVDVAVIETGLGGRLDATNIVVPELSVVTNIGIEHTQYLGDTREKIAREKAGIIKPRGIAVVGERGDEGEWRCSHIFEQHCLKIAAQLTFAEDRYSVAESVAYADYQDIMVDRLSDGEPFCYSLDLKGVYQRQNLVTLLTAVDQINTHPEIPLSISNKALREGLKSVATSTALLGRWQRLASSPLTICDTGHNLDGLREVVRQIEQQSYRKLYCVLGFARDKALEQILPLFPRDTHFIFTRPCVERAFETSHLVDVARSMGLSCESVEGVQSALDYARTLAQSEDMIFVGGSNFVVAEIEELDS